MKSWIPNLFTLSNLILGVMSIISTYHGLYTQAALLVFAALVADGLDGRVARFFGVSSDFGKELDSLCDLVSFGVAPGFLAYVYWLKDFGIAGGLIAAFFAACGAFRLARFNVMASVVKGYFMGLPIPAGGCAVATFVMLGMKPSGVLFPIMVLVFGYLMVSTIKYPDFKGKGERIRPIPALISLAVAGYIIMTAPGAILFTVFFSYALFGILNTIFGLFEPKPAA